MITGTLEELDELIKSHRCPEHDNPLQVTWNGNLNTHVIACGAGHFPEEITPIPSLTEEFKQGAELSEPIPANIKQRVIRHNGKTTHTAEDIQMALIPKWDLADGKALTPDTIKSMIAYAEHYGLDAYRGHICIMYGKPYITIDGYLFYAKRAGKPYQLRTRPLTEEEKIELQLSPKDHAWKCEITTLPDNSFFIGLGVVTQAEMTEMAKGKPGQLRSPVVARHPWQLAQKRAEWQALRRAFPIGGEGEVTNE